jgi:hypothetical protein
MLFALIAAALAISWTGTARIVWWDARFEYSHARRMAHYLLCQGLERRPIAATYEAESVLPYLPDRRFWYADTRRFGSYTIWDLNHEHNAFLDPEEVARRALERFPAATDLLVITVEPISEPESKGLRLCYTTTPAPVLFWEHFYLYKRTEQRDW